MQAAILLAFLVSAFVSADYQPYGERTAIATRPARVKPTAETCTKEFRPEATREKKIEGTRYGYGEAPAATGIHERTEIGTRPARVKPTAETCTKEFRPEATREKKIEATAYGETPAATGIPAGVAPTAFVPPVGNIYAAQTNLYASSASSWVVGGVAVAALFLQF